MKQLQILFILVLMLNSACIREGANCHKSIKIDNKSSIDIYVTGDESYPDTMGIMHRAELVSDEYHTKVYANSLSTRSLQMRDCWENLLQDIRYLKSDTLQIFIFDANILEKKPWEDVWSDVVHNYKILKRYDISLSDLQNLHFTVSYPPTSEMKDIKQYPPYSE